MVKKRIGELASQAAAESVDCDLLNSISHCLDIDSEIREKAHQRIIDIKIPKDAPQRQLLDIAISDPMMRGAALDKIKDEDLLCEAIVTFASEDDPQTPLVRRITNPELLRRVVADKCLEIETRVEAARMMGLKGLLDYRTLICPKCGQHIYRYTAYESIDSYDVVEGYECHNCGLSSGYKDGFTMFRTSDDDELDLTGSLALVCRNCGNVRRLITNTSGLPYSHCSCSGNVDCYLLKYYDEH